MKQIKTIARSAPDLFDEAVNACLKDGWELKCVGSTATHIYAVMEADVVDERCCDNCRHCEKLGDEPCIYCNKDLNRWEAKA